MLNLLKNMYEPISKGNQYRLEKYGKPDGFVESFHRARKMTKLYRENLPKKTQTTKERNNILKRASVWKRWSGSRFVEIDNPIKNMSWSEFVKSEWYAGEYKKPEIFNYTAKSNPVTGDYEIETF